VTARGLHEQLLALKKQQRGELGEVLSSLRHRAAAVSSEQRRVATEAESRRRGLAERLQTEEHRLQLEQRHLARDCDALEEESAATEAAIASQLGPAGEARDALKHQCATLDDEVSELERQLAAKRAAAQTAHAELAAAEAAVSDVRKRFDRQLSRIADRRAALDATRRECCQEESSLEADRQRLSAETAAEEKAAREAESWTKVIDAELSVGLLLQAALEDTPGWQGREQGQQGSGGGAVGHAWGVDPALRTELAEALLALQAATSVSSEVQLALDALVEESASLTEQLPKLEAEKKAHAAARRFKEAAQSSKDHKAMSARKEEVDAAMGEAKARLELRLEAVEQCRSRQGVASGAVERAEAAARDQRFEVLLENARGLRGRVLRLALEPEGGRESGLSIKRAAVLLLEAEIEVSRAWLCLVLLLSQLAVMQCNIERLSRDRPNYTNPNPIPLPPCLYVFSTVRPLRGTGSQTRLGPRICVSRPAPARPRKPRRHSHDGKCYISSLCLCICICLCRGLGSEGSIRRRLRRSRSRGRGSCSRVCGSLCRRFLSLSPCLFQRKRQRERE